MSQIVGLFPPAVIGYMLGGDDARNDYWVPRDPELDGDNLRDLIRSDRFTASGKSARTPWVAMLKNFGDRAGRSMAMGYLLAAVELARGKGDLGSVDYLGLGDRIGYTTDWSMMPEDLLSPHCRVAAVYEKLIEQGVGALAETELLTLAAEIKRRRRNGESFRRIGRSIGPSLGWIRRREVLRLIERVCTEHGDAADIELLKVGEAKWIRAVAFAVLPEQVLAGEVLETVEQWLEEHPERRREKASLLIYEALNLCAAVRTVVRHYRQPTIVTESEACKAWPP